MTKTIAFYAPLKSPKHPTPSGDRLIARLFTSLFEEIGYNVTIISEFRSWSAEGINQENIKTQALKEANALCQKYKSIPKNDRPILWFTYHLYHKAPDWIGPIFSQQFDIPYLIAEASIAPKRKIGEWALGYEDALNAIMQATQILTLAPHDQTLLQQFIPHDRLITFLPFTPKSRPLENKKSLKERLAETYHLPLSKKWCLTAAMMRNDCKKRSYLELIDALSLVHDDNACALFVGDGDARQEIETLSKQIDFPIYCLGQLSPSRVHEFCQASDLYLWPAINEAYGMSILEAQSAGLPVIAGNFGSVATLVEHEKTGIILPQNQPHLFADSIHSLLNDQSRLDLLSQNAFKRADDKFSFRRAKAQMKTIIETLTKDASNV